MYPDEEIFGWFTNGSSSKVTEVEEQLNRQFGKLSEGPLLLKFDTEHLQSTGRVSFFTFDNFSYC